MTPNTPHPQHAPNTATSTAPDTPGATGNQTLVTTALNTVQADPADIAIPAGTDASTGVIWVTATGNPHDIQTTCAAAGAPSRIDVITRSRSTIPVRGTALTVHTLPNDRGLESLADQLFTCIDTVDAAGHDPVIVLDNLYEIFTNTSLKTMYFFLHVLTMQARANDWSVTVGLDSTLLDPKIPTVLSTLFDTIE